MVMAVGVRSYSVRVWTEGTGKASDCVLLVHRSSGPPSPRLSDKQLLLLRARHARAGHLTARPAHPSAAAVSSAS